MGDMFVISTTVDYDLGHHADSREMEDQTTETWFRNESFDSAAVIRLDPDLTDRVYELIQNVPRTFLKRPCTNCFAAGKALSCIETVFGFA